MGFDRQLIKLISTNDILRQGILKTLFDYHGFIEKSQTVTKIIDSCQNVIYLVSNWELYRLKNFDIKIAIELM